ncbi:MAG: hypothetical protein KF691_01450 [Phycisphaeraceae bacterium]|nr:hypothetical protein [Phycisphaeraceae bacterium]
MRTLVLSALVSAGAAVASCATKPPDPGAGMTGAFSLRNDSASILYVQPFAAPKGGGPREPIGSEFSIAPRSNASRELGAPDKSIWLTIRASRQARKYLSGEWVVAERAGGFHLYAFTDDTDTVRLNWHDRGGEEILMQ